MNGAPFPLDTYEDTQQMYGMVTRYGRFEFALFDIFDYMPQTPPKLTQAEKETILHDWACQCAPPKDPMEMCP